MRPTSSIHPQYDYRKGQRLTGYRVARQMTARVRDLRPLGAVLDGIVAAGANEVHGAQMSASDPSAAEHEALRRPWRPRAPRLRRLVSRGGGRWAPSTASRRSRDHGPPMPRMRMMAMAESTDVPTEVAAGDLTVTRRIRAWFEIA